MYELSSLFYFKKSLFSKAADQSSQVPGELTRCTCFGKLYLNITTNVTLKMVVMLMRILYKCMKFVLIIIILAFFSQKFLHLQIGFSIARLIVLRKCLFEYIFRRGDKRFLSGACHIQGKCIDCLGHF